MAEPTQPPPEQPSPGAPTPREHAVQNAANAANAHEQNPDPTTLRTLQDAVQAALNLGATLTDIRQARGDRLISTIDRGATVEQIQARAAVDYALAADIRPTIGRRDEDGRR